MMTRRLFGSILSLLALAACGEDGPTDPEIFSQPDLVEIVSQGFVVATGTTALTSASFTLAPGVEIDVEVNFLDESGVLITPLSGEFLEVIVDDETIGTFTQDATGAFTGTMKGLTLGSTGVVFRYMYGGVGSPSAKASFVSAEFDFIVG
jgi:hypothetical protein